MYASAWSTSAIADKDVDEFVKYDKWDGLKDARPNPEARPKAQASEATAPLR
jgi:hypothetical protein